MDLYWLSPLIVTRSLSYLKIFNALEANDCKPINDIFLKWTSTFLFPGLRSTPVFVALNWRDVRFIHAFFQLRITGIRLLAKSPFSPFPVTGPRFSLRFHRVIARTTNLIYTPKAPLESSESELHVRGE